VKQYLHNIWSQTTLDPKDDADTKRSIVEYNNVVEERQEDTILDVEDSEYDAIGQRWWKVNTPPPPGPVEILTPEEYYRRLENESKAR